MDKTRMITSPSQCFKTVQELVENKMLTHEEKIISLKNWKSTCELYKESTNEGMQGGGNPTSLTDVLAALRKFESLQIER